ncbi:MAG TPA: hypothetical protein VGI66_13645 [Streptosporangiaceae bacterium]|jgi:hypothetical protein
MSFATAPFTFTRVEDARDVASQADEVFRAATDDQDGRGELAAALAGLHRMVSRLEQHATGYRDAADEAAELAACASREAGHAECARNDARQEIRSIASDPMANSTTIPRHST